MSEVIIHKVNAENERPCIISVINNLLQSSPGKDVTIIVPENMTLEYEQ